MCGVQATWLVSCWVRRSGHMFAWHREYVGLGGRLDLVVPDGLS